MSLRTSSLASAGSTAVAQGSIKKVCKDQQTFKDTEGIVFESKGSILGTGIVQIMKRSVLFAL